MFILIIGINNILKFNTLRHSLWLLSIYTYKDHEVFTWLCFHPSTLKKKTFLWDKTSIHQVSWKTMKLINLAKALHRAVTFKKKHFWNNHPLVLPQANTYFMDTLLFMHYFTHIICKGWFQNQLLKPNYGLLHHGRIMK